MMGDQKGIQSDGELQKERGQQRDRIRGLVLGPVHWFKMLSKELDCSFVLSVVIVYGINQGAGMALSRVGTQYYMKDEQKLQPSEAQFYSGIIQIPWLVKPFWGLLTDTVPIFGYKRRPYFIFAGIIGMISMLTLSLHSNLRLVFAIFSLMAGSAGVAIADVTIDACVTENSISHPPLAADMQSLCGVSSSVGALIGFTFSGFLVHLIGSKGLFGFLSIPTGLVILVGVMLREASVHKANSRRVSKTVLDVGKAMWMALRCPNVWRPCLFMYLSLALSLNIHEGMFYWMTAAKGGPSFSQEVVGSVYAVGAVGSLFGVILYQNVFKNHPFRIVIFWTQFLHGASGMLELILVLRLNQKFGVPDYLLAVIDASVSHMIGRLRWMPLLVLSSKLCPSGIEGTFFALLMSIDHVGMLSSSWAGGLVLHVINVTRTKFDNLWAAIVIRSLLRILPISLLFLVPDSDPNSSILPSEMLAKRDDDAIESNNVELAPLVESV